MAAISTTVRNLVIFRRSIRPHSVMAFLVEYLCFILELLEKDKQVAKLLGVVCAFDTCLFTFLDIKFELTRRKISCKKQRYYCCYRFYYPNGEPYILQKFEVYLMALSVLHLVSTIVSLMLHSAYLVLVPLILAGLELIPHEAYHVFQTQTAADDHEEEEVEEEEVAQNQGLVNFDVEEAQPQTPTAVTRGSTGTPTSAEEIQQVEIN